jgi:hypothetical protein
VFAASKPRVAMSNLEERLWNDAVSPKDYEGSGEKYQAAILEQYKIYVEMADRISSRRSLTNTFFLTLNSAVFTLIGVFWQHQPSASKWFLLFPLAVALGQCSAWWWLVRSYRQLNAAKFQVVGALEQRLPASPCWRAEWTALGEGRDPKLYFPLTHLEQWVPILFGLVYLIGCIAVLAV